MLFVKKVVQVPEQPVVQETRVVQPTQRTVVVDRSSLSQGTILAIVLGSMALLAMAIYYWWYRPNYVEVQTPTVIERTHEIVTQPAPSGTTPPVVIQQPPVVIHDQAPTSTTQPDHTVIVQGTGGAEPPATSSGSSNTTGSDTSNGSTSSDHNSTTTGGR